MNNSVIETMQRFGLGIVKELSNTDVHFHAGLPNYDVFVYVLSYTLNHTLPKYNQ